MSLLVVSTACGDATLDLFSADVGLLAHWALDEGHPGGPIVDSGGFGLDGSTSPNPPTPSTSVPPVHFPDRSSLSFNGTDQWISLGNPPILNLGGVITLAAWIRPRSLDGFHTVVTHGFRTNPSHDVGLRITSGIYEFAFWNDVNHAARAPIDPADLNTWVHLCGTFDGSAYKIYRNGVLEVSTPDAASPPANVDTFWSIGAKIPMPTNLDRLMDGEIDDVRIYGRALSADEVRKLASR